MHGRHVPAPRLHPVKARPEGGADPAGDGPARYTIVSGKEGFLGETLPTPAKRQRNERGRQGADAVHDQVNNGICDGVPGARCPFEDPPVGLGGHAQGEH